MEKRRASIGKFMILLITLLSFFAILTGCAGTSTEDTTTEDTTKPTAPTNLKVNPKSTSSIDLSWDPSTDDVGVVGYEVYRGGTKIGTVNKTSYSDKELEPDKEYCYTVRAYDNAGNLSDPSNNVCAKTYPLPSAIGEKFPIATTPAPEFGVSAAFDGTNYLVGILGDAEDPANVTAQFISSEGELVGERISTGRKGSFPVVVFNGTNYLMVWPDESGPLYGMVLGKDGSVVKAPFSISSMPAQDESIEEPPYAVCRKDGGCSVMWELEKEVPDGPDIRKVFKRDVDKDGNLVSEEMLIDPEGGGPFGACDDEDNCIVAYDTGYKIKAYIFGPTINRGPFVIADKNQACRDTNPSPVAFDGTNYLIVWNDRSDCSEYPQWDILGQRVDRKGNPVGNKFQVNDSQKTRRAAIPFLAFDGTNFLVTWIDGRNDTDRDGICDPDEGTCYDVYGQYISKSGELFGSEFVISNESKNEFGFVTGYANGKYLVLVNTGEELEFPAGGDLYGIFIK